MSMAPVACDYGQEEDIKPRAPVIPRNLFGPVDHQQLQEDFQRLLYMSVEIAKQRWSFDFQRDKPVPGHVKWEEMHSQDVPMFYHSCEVRSNMAKQMVEGPLALATEKYPDMRTRGTLRGIKPEKRMATLVGIKRRQANITDFFRVTKRRFLLHKTSSGQ